MKAEDIRPELPIFAKDPEARGASHVRKVGTVDHLDHGRFVKMKRQDSFDGQHHWIPVEWVEAADEGGIYLDRDHQRFFQELLKYDDQGDEPADLEAAKGLNDAARVPEAS
jgi:hypothetical protein